MDTRWPYDRAAKLSGSTGRNMPKIMTGNGWLTSFLSGMFAYFLVFLVFFGALLPKTYVFFFASAATVRLHANQYLVPYHTGAYSITTSRYNYFLQLTQPSCRTPTVLPHRIRAAAPDSSQLPQSR